MWADLVPALAAIPAPGPRALHVIVRPSSSAGTA